MYSLNGGFGKSNVSSSGGGGGAAWYGCARLHFQVKIHVEVWVPTYLNPNFVLGIDDGTSVLITAIVGLQLQI